MQEEVGKATSKDESKKKKKFKFPKVRLRFLLFWILIFIGLGAFIVAEASSYANTRADLNDVQARIAEEEAIIEALQIQLAFFDSDVYIEQLARDRLGMIYPNQIVFRNIAD